MCCSKWYIPGKIDFIHIMTCDTILKHLSKFAKFQKVTKSSTEFYRPINLTNEWLNQWQNTVVLRHLIHVNISQDKQRLSRGQSVSQSDRLFAITLVCNMSKHWCLYIDDNVSFVCFIQLSTSIITHRFTNTNSDSYVSAILFWKYDVIWHNVIIYKLYNDTYTGKAWLRHWNQYIKNYVAFCDPPRKSLTSDPPPQKKNVDVVFASPRF